MSTQTFSYLKIFTLTLLLLKLSTSAKHGDSTIEEILADLDLSDEMMLENLNKVHFELFDNYISDSDGLSKFLVQFSATGAKKQAEIQKMIIDGQEPSIFNDLNQKLTDIVKKHREEIKNDDFTAVIEECDPILKEYIFYQLIANGLNQDSATLLINMDTLIEKFVRIKSTYTELLKEELNSTNVQIKKFVNTSLSTVLLEALILNINRAINSTEKSKEEMDRELEKTVAISQSLTIVKELMGNPVLIEDNIKNMLIDGMKAVRLQEDRLKFGYLFGVMKAIFVNYSKPAFKTVNNKFDVLVTLVYGLLSYEKHANLIFNKRPEFRKFLNRRLETGRLIRDLTEAKNDSQKNQLIMGLFDYLIEIFDHNSEDMDKKEAQQLWIDNMKKNHCYFDDSDFIRLLENFNDLSDLSFSFYKGWSISFPIFASKLMKTQEKAEYEYVNSFYNLWLRFKAENIDELNRNNRAELLDEYLDNLYENNDNDENSLYPVRINENYGLYKVIVSYFSTNSNIMIDFKTLDEAKAFHASMNATDSHLKTYLVKYFQSFPIEVAGKKFDDFESKDIAEHLQSFELADLPQIEFDRLNSTVSVDLEDMEEESGNESE